MMDYYRFVARSSYQDSLKVLEADIQHSNMLMKWLAKPFLSRANGNPSAVIRAASMPRPKGNAYLQMKLVYNHFAPVFWFFLQWMDCSCTYLLPRYLNPFHIIVYKVSPDGKIMSSHGRIATIREFYAVILPSLQHLYDNNSALDLNHNEDHDFETIVRKRLEEKKKHSDVDLEREDECGICLEPCTKMVLPNCCHAMCINCYRDWSMRSESCPFCRGSLKRVNSSDLWVLTCSGDVIDTETASKEDMLHFNLYINSLPKDIPDTLFFMYYEYLI
ncbi:E3 ubiquitin-protein like [Actinidia chinensis var. chinensis]|uniref:E3 ubiquitin-protein like n=1 Tax=Actinidia chinensis var. chinensis TaxID=1590841 RepID=A0A2R6PSA9_ACTCC|nr:E3 ubiquitin-protein like [Actinidia chinensis var. chinensis]